MALSQLDLAEAIEQARRLDLFALGQIHDHYFPQVFRYINFRLNNRAISLEITTELLRMLLTSWHKFGPGIDDLQAWLFNNAASLVDEKIAQARLDNPASLDINADRLTTTNEENESVKWLGALVQTVLNGITPEQQHILALRFSESRSLTDIAKLTNKNLAELRILQYSGLSVLRRLLEKEANAK